MTDVIVEQLLIGWSRTSNGKNVLARSPGWPSEPSRSAWVSALGDFLGPSTDRLVRDTGETPWFLEFLPSGHGSLLMAKVYAAESLRAGEFQVHALLDPSRTLGPQHLPALAAAGVLLLERPADITRLDTLSLAIPPAPIPLGVRQLALALRFLHRGGPLLVQATTLSEASELLGELAAALPDSVAAGTPARSVITDAADAQGIAVAVPPWSKGADEVPTVAAVPGIDTYLELAHRMLDGELVLPPEDFADWFDVAVLDHETLTPEVLARGLTGACPRHWLEAAFAAPRTRDLLIDLMQRGGVPERAWPELNTITRELNRLLRASARTQAAAAAAVPDNLLRPLATRLGGRLVVEAPALVDRLRKLQLSPARFTLRTGGDTWTEWTDEAWRQWLEADTKLWPGLDRTIDADGFTGHFARLLDRLPRTALDPALAQLRRWPPERLGLLVEALIRCRDTSPELLIQTLDRLPADDVRRLVQRHWPTLGEQLGLPMTVVQALKPNRGWLW